ncbi:hypothetical protein ACSBLW_18770 [Thioclava sp. FR2]|uniref:hypothetical protein n=1 Tax=Thioclava sp. FR2 TaxID=3445780 RepID=UPI003EB92085
MNSTPDFDVLGQHVPIEPMRSLRAVALLRLLLVLLALGVCVAQILQIGVWSALVDRAVILLGLSGGLGLYSDSIEIVWRRLGPLGRFVTLLLTLILVAASVLSQGNQILHSVAVLWVMLILGSMAYGLVHSLIDPLRALRFRQMKRYLRTLPKERRRDMHKRLELDFQTLIAEGFR